MLSAGKHELSRSAALRPAHERRSLRRQTGGRMRWLAGVAAPCSDRVGLEETARSVLTYAGPHFHWRVNIYDSTNASCARWATAASVKRFVWTSHVPGYMTLFWKKVLVPSLTNSYDRIFILDNDVRLTPQLGFSAARIDRWFASTNAMIMQPSVIAADVGPGARSGSGVKNHHAFTASCAAHAIESPERLHISRPEAYALLHQLLMDIPDKRLDTDTGMMYLWTALTCEAFPRRPSCLLVNSIAVVHLNTKTITKAGLDPQYNDPRAKKNNVLFFTWDHPTYGRLMNKSVVPFQENQCGIPARTVDDLGLRTDGTPVRRKKKGTGPFVAATCHPLLDDLPNATQIEALSL